jgi:hypothetical protein
MPTLVDALQPQGLFEVTGSTSKNNESLHGVLDGSTGIISGEEVIDSHLLVLILLIWKI